MDYTLHPLRQIDPSLLPSLAHLHQKEDHGLLSDLGYPFVFRYFEVVLQDERVIGFYALSDSGELVGYTVGSPEPAALTSQLTREKGWFVRQAARVLFTRPLIFLQLVISGLSIRGQMENETDAIESIYLTVDSAMRGRGIGRALQQSLIKAAREAGYKRILGSIQLWNKASLAVTTSNGFKVISTFREGFYKRYRVELIL
jgi:GNAT superfamily N-acetyltransferase